MTAVDLATLDTPALLIDLDIVRRNLKEMQKKADECKVDLRPHIKTHKIPELAHLQLDLGARGITVAKVSEAEVMAAAGIKDNLVRVAVGLENVEDLMADLARGLNGA